jgi:hypothetical protein
MYEDLWQQNYAVQIQIQAALQASIDDYSMVIDPQRHCPIAIRR